jgi:hypothetical protein
LDSLRRIVDQFGHSSGGVLDALEISLAGFAKLRGAFVGEDGGIAAKLGERAAQVVGNAVGEGLEFLVPSLQLGSALLDAVLEMFVELGDLGLGTNALQGIEDGAPEVVAGGVHFSDKVLRAFVNQFESQSIVGVPGQNDSGGAKSLGPGAQKSFLAKAVRECEIEKHNVDTAGVET